MFGIGVLVFREVLEAALIISVVCAATRGIAGRGRFVSIGLLAGIAGAVLVALFAGRIADAASGVGQEIFNAGVLLAAVFMIAWHAIWMSSHGRKLALDSRAVGDAVRGGSRPLSALIVVIAIAVLREGSEVVLFLYGMAADGTSRAGLALGSLGGVVVGAVLGFALYFGLLRIPLRHFFSATNWLLLLLAAGMASSAARFLIQADLLPALHPRLWDSSAIVSDQSVFGQLLHVLVGYDARPAGMQLAFYAATLFLIAIGMKIWGRPPAIRQLAT